MKQITFTRNGGGTMRNWLWSVLMAAALALGGCAEMARRQEAREAREAQERDTYFANQNAADNAACSNYGFQQGTQNYAQCRMMIDQNRQNAAAQDDAQQRAILLQHLMRR